MDKRTFINVGGQAVIEGIAMKGPNETCLAVRKQDGTIVTEMFTNKNKPFAKIPVLRGAAAMIMSLICGYTYINRSMDLSGAFDEPEEKKIGDKKDSEPGLANLVTVIASVLGVALAILLFTVLPTWIAGLFSKVFHVTGGLAIIESISKIAIFVLYLFSVTRMKEVHRVFEYHGAEHKTINCIEMHEELTVENVLKQSRFHPRCGTSFLFLVVFISVFFYTFLPWTNVLSRSLTKIVLIPVITGVAYEVLQFAGKHDNGFTKILSAPGLAIQRLTTFEPDASEVEVAITAIKAVMPQEKEN